MMKPAWLPLFAILVMPFAAKAKVYECTAADEESRIGVSPRSVVAITADEDEKLCAFSINGFRTGSPPQDELTAAMNRLFPDNGVFIGRLAGADAVPIDALAALLVSAGPDEASADMTAILSQAGEQLDQCLQGFESGQSLALDAPTDGAGFACFVNTEAGIDLGLVRTFELEAPETQPPQLILRVSRGPLENLLFISR